MTPNERKDLIEEILDYIAEEAGKERITAWTKFQGLRQKIVSKFGCHTDPVGRNEKIRGHAEEIAALKAERAKLQEALTPNEKTKAAFASGFMFEIFDTDELGCAVTRYVTVPWVTITEIMAAICTYSNLREGA